MTKSAISDQTIQNDLEEMIKISGNGFHVKVVGQLKKLGWDVQVSPYYNDFSTDKTREIDIVAIKNEIVSSFYRQNQKDESISLRLFIECKYFDKPTLLWFMEKNKIDAAKLDIVKNERTDLFSHNILGDEVVKLWQYKGSSDLLFQAMNSSLNSRIFFEQYKKDNLRNTINISMIVVNSYNSFYKVNFENEKKFTQIENSFQLEINYSFLDEDKQNTTKYFLIDVVSLDDLEFFLQKINDSDFRILRENIREKLYNQMGHS